jgi:D-threo-aldose 1-dehydrogenase
MHASATWPRLGLGCATLGTPPPYLSDSEADAVIVTAIDRGIRFFDVAPLYGGGLAEARLGRALAGLPRDDYVLCTKTGVTRPYGQPALGPGAARRRQYDRWDYSAAGTRASIETSLERLRTDRLDIVHLHDAENHLDRCLDAHAELVRLRDQGAVGGIGIGSNLVAPVQQLIDRASFDAFLLAGCYTLLDTSGRGLIEGAKQRGIAVVVGGVYNSGVLAAWPQSAPTFGYLPAEADILERTARIAAVCARHAVPLAAVALQFVLAQPAIQTVLIGPRTVAELETNLASTELQIPAALWTELVAGNLIPADAPRFGPAAAPTTAQSTALH